MSPRQSRFDRFARDVERRAAAHRSLDRRSPLETVDADDIVRCAARAALSLAEASAALDEMEASGRWERVLVDEYGRVLSQEQANVILRGAMFGGGARVKVVWRRREPRAVLAA